MNTNDNIFKIRKKKEILKKNDSFNNVDNSYMNLNFNLENKENTQDLEKAIQLVLYDHDNHDTLFIEEIDNLDENSLNL